MPAAFARRSRGTRAALAAFAQWIQQAFQAVMVHLVHQREQPAELAARKPFTGHPVEVMPGKVGDEPAFVFAEGHGDGNEAFEVWD